jgi:hypothetical protein
MNETEKIDDPGVWAKEADDSLSEHAVYTRYPGPVPTLEDAIKPSQPPKSSVNFPASGWG